MRDGRRGDTGRCEVYRGAAWNRKSWPRPPVEKSGRIRHNLVASMVHISRVYPSWGWGCCWFITCSSSSLSVGWCTQVQRASKRNGRVKRERITRRTVPSPLLTNGCVNIKIVRRFSRSISPSIYRWCAFTAAIHQRFRFSRPLTRGGGSRFNGSFDCRQCVWVADRYTSTSAQFFFTD